MPKVADESPSILISLRLPPAMCKALDSRAERERRSRSDLIRMLLEAGLEADGLDPQMRMKRIEREARELGRKMRLGQLT